MGLGAFYDNINGDNRNINNMIYYNICKQINKNIIFSLYVNFTKNGEINNYGGNLSFGYYNKSRDIKWIELNNDKYKPDFYQYWAVELSKIEINNKNYNIYINNGVIIDSGTSEICQSRIIYNDNGQLFWVYRFYKDIIMFMISIIKEWVFL